MGDAVMRFEIGCKDRPAARTFYQKSFGWMIEEGDLSGEIATGDDSGIDGALTALGHEPHQYVMIYVTVEDIADACESVAANGGAVTIGPLDIPGGKGRFAWFDDPEGNTLGLFEPPK
jgi:predicted enzyme related to lactoylglutathione lyase